MIHLKRVGNLYEKIYDLNILQLAHKEASKNKKHYKDVIMVNKNPKFYLKEIQNMLMNESYNIQEADYIQREIVDKGKKRILHVLPYYPHRIIQWAIILVIGDIFKNMFISTSFASVEGRGQLKASLELRKGIQTSGQDYFLQLDIKKFYPNVDRTILKRLLRRKFKDIKLLKLLDLIIDTAPELKGIPLGSLMSQWLGNFYLTYFDHFVKENLGIKYYYRYCDDLIILGKSRKELNKIKKEIYLYLKNELRLSIKNTYALRNISEGIDFVGYVHYPNNTLLRRRNKYSLRSVSHELQNKAKVGKKLTENDLSRIASYGGWVKYCDCIGLRKTYIDPVIEIFQKQILEEE